MSSPKFNDMLDNIYLKINENNKITLILPDLDLEIISNKLYWKNIKEILKRLNRPPDNIFNFISNEYPNLYWKTGSISDGLMINEKIKKKHIITLFKRYINDYVLCKVCKSYNTILSKDNKKRLNQIICNDCNSDYYVT